LHDNVLQEFIDMEKPESQCLWMLHHFNFFCLHKRFIEKVGWFDENFYPAYFEDNDFVYRCNLAEMPPGHTTPEMTAKAEHKGSQTIKSDPQYAQGNNNTFGSWNATHYRMKWGGRPGAETFRTPYGKPENDIRWWPDPGGSIAHRDWDNGRERVR
jgi:GT2 family glycosyltransferase